MKLEDSIQKEISDARKFYEAWKLYEMATEVAMVIRSGSWIYGVYLMPLQDKDFLIDRGESVAEHEHGMAILADAVFRWFKEDAPSDDFYEYAIYSALTHDTGEVVIGDIPDDGLRDEPHKIEAEKLQMEKLAQHMPVEDRWRFLYTYQCFERRDVDNAGGLGVFLALCDKFESLLRQVRYERDGHIGHLGACGIVSDRDREVSERVGTDYVLDIWSCAMFDRFESLIGQVKLFRDMLGILTAAVIDVRGEAFPWAQRLYFKLGIPVDELKEICRAEATAI